MNALVLVLAIAATAFASGEEKYPKKTLIEIQVESCKGGNADRLDLLGKPTREKVFRLFKIPREDKWEGRSSLEPINYIFRNTGKRNCKDLLAQGKVIFEKVDRGPECSKAARKQWWCAYAGRNLMGEAAEYSSYF